MFYKNKFTLIVILLLWRAELRSAQSDGTTPTTPYLSTSFQEFARSDIGQADVDDALILEVGKYTTETFDYINNQFAQFIDPFDVYWNGQANKCSDDYIKCVVNQDNPTPVCGYNHNYPRWEDHGARSFVSYCHLYYDNCLIGYRYWRTINTGKCYDTGWNEQYISYAESFRKSFKKLFNYIKLGKIKKLLHL